MTLDEMTAKLLEPYREIANRTRDKEACFAILGLIRMVELASDELAQSGRRRKRKRRERELDTIDRMIDWDKYARDAAGQPE